MYNTSLITMIMVLMIHFRRSNLICKRLNFILKRSNLIFKRSNTEPESYKKNIKHHNIFTKKKKSNTKRKKDWQSPSCVARKRDYFYFFTSVLRLWDFNFEIPLTCTLSIYLCPGLSKKKNLSYFSAEAKIKNLFSLISRLVISQSKHLSTNVLFPRNSHIREF